MNQPDNYDIVEKLNIEGESLFQDGNMEKAKDRFLKALTLDPDNCRTLNNLGVLSWFSGEVQSALENFTKAYEINPYHRQVVQNLLEILAKLNQQEEVDLIRKTYLERYPEDEEIAGFLQDTPSIEG